ncbi:LysR family transcriptional regulator (plasmid) [Azospirillum humicireducens]|uniref:HTH-type transcriptional regulator CbbR n=2 Tax=Azospirillum humicireducens TaxID=1226968 RepID=A0A2R4VX25_9PROT|nr:LysR family transcriptional regulator [Azospirillum humicireducens]
MGWPMTIQHATLRQLQIFTAAARSLSFARVAERFGLTPGAVSFQIKQVEGHCGFPLFERVGRGVVLTEAGRDLLEHATLILQALDNADRRMQALKGVTGGNVTIGLVSTAKYIAPHMVSRFQAERPGVSIHLQDGNRREVNAMVAKGEVDLAIMGRPLDEEELLAEPFARHPSIIICAPTHPLADAPALRLSDLAGSGFIAREEGAGTRALTEACFHGQGFSPRIVMTSSSNETIKQAVMAGIGIALLSRHTVDLELALGMLRELKVEGLPLMRSWYIAHRRSLPLLPVHAQLRSYLLERGQAIIDSIQAGHRALASGR